MNNYRIVIWNNIANEPQTIMEMRRPYFTKREYDLVVQEMLFWAAKSIDYKSLTTDIYCNEKWAFCVACETIADYPRIDALVSANGLPVRCMNIAS